MEIQDALKGTGIAINNRCGPVKVSNGVLVFLHTHGPVEVSDILDSTWQTYHEPELCAACN